MDHQVIISGLSSPEVLTDLGFTNYAISLGMSVGLTLFRCVTRCSRLSLTRSIECLDIHLGGPQSANLGDGNGQVNQTIEMRQDFGNEIIGTCLESLVGGNHLRYASCCPGAVGSE